MENSFQTPDSTPQGPDLIVRGKRIITPEGERPAAIRIRGGVIAGISAYGDIPSGSTLYDAGNLAVLPGLVDTHVHINEPGRTEWEGFATTTRAAAAGGVTTLIEMPLNSIPPTTTVNAFHEKLAATAGKLWVDTGFWGGLVPGNTGELCGLWEAGCFGFKCFLVDSGVQEFASVSEKDLREALPELARIAVPLLTHAELPGPIDDAAKHRPANASSRSYKTWLDSRPRAAENEAIAFLLRLAAEYGAHVHIVHLSSSDAIPTIREAKANGMRVSAETCPHYVTFAAEEIPDGATQFKCAPPIRERENREQLWAALADGTLDMIATDHSPCPPPMKKQEKGDFLDAWGGIASLQLSLPAVWTQARARGYSLTHIAQWMCAGPARLAGLEKRKGAIAIGRDADLVIWDPDAAFRVDPARLQHRHKLTPYAGLELMGIVETTFVCGKKIFDRGEVSAAPAGRVLLRANDE
jgi:allantoinase